MGEPRMPVARPPSGACVNSRAWPFAVVVAMLANTGCGGDAASSTSSRIVLSIEVGDQEPRPDHLVVSWVGGDGVLGRDRRVPETGSLPPSGAVLGTIELELGDKGGDERTVIVRGMRGSMQVSEGFVRVTSMPGGARHASVQLSPGSLPDGDGDGFPDAADTCPKARNPEQKRCEGAGQGGAGGSDDDRQEGRDAGLAPGDAAGSQGGQAGSATDAGSKGTGGAAGSSNRARGKSCSRNDECDTAVCAGGASGRYCSSTGMVVVPSGPFLRGCDPSRDANCDADERPARTIETSAFEIDVTEVTQAAYAACVVSKQCTAPSTSWNPSARGTLPVTGVSWDMAAAYCGWAGKRLPTEAEWEKAARGPGERFRYPWGDQDPTCLVAQFASCGLADVVPTAALGDASAHGARDLAGNAAEWVADWYSATAYEGADEKDPRGPRTGAVHVIRGGSFESSAVDIRVSARAAGPAGAAPSVGFRCADDL